MVRRTDAKPTITVLGAGYVGLTTAALLANAGFKVYVVEPNDKRLKTIRQGRSFFYEEGLDPLIAHGVKNGTLIPTKSYADSVPNSSIVISAVGTPDNPDGSPNLAYLFAAAEEAADHLKPNVVYVQKSTVPVGTGARIKKLFKGKNNKAAYASNPEFLRESTALRDSLWPDRIVIGSDNKEATEHILSVYRQVQQARNEIAALSGLEAPSQHPAGRYISTSLESAELIKVSSNAFLALKISFANSIAKFADQTGANITEVMDAVGTDTRIGHAFLHAGRGYGGGCFPKDVNGLISSATEHGVNLPIMAAVAEVNESMPGYIISKAQSMLGSLEGKHVAVLGLAFKAGTSDARRSPGVKIANILSHSGAMVTAYDPQAKNEAEAELRKGIILCDSLEKAVEGAGAVFVATDWPEFVGYDPVKLSNRMKGNVFVDCMNAFLPQAIAAAGFQYVGVGR